MVTTGWLQFRIDWGKQIFGIKGVIVKGGGWKYWQVEKIEKWLKQNVVGAKCVRKQERTNTTTENKKY